MENNESIRQRRVRQVWDWLPAFRAVAETEHLPTAAKRLGVTASALSRTLALVERDVGRPLFARAGRGLTLNASGRALLASVRDAMRRVDEGLADVEGGRMRGPVRIASAGHIPVAYVVPALRRLRAAHPDLRPEIRVVAPSEVPAALLSGELDLALLADPAFGEDVATEWRGAEPHSVWCGVGHPLYGRTDVAVDEVVRFAFCGPPADPDGRTADGWPVELERIVAVRFSQIYVGLAACEGGDLLAVLPDVLTRGRPLWRVPVEVVPGTPMFAVRRHPMGPEGSVDVLLAAVKAELTAAGVAPPRGP